MIAQLLKQGHSRRIILLVCGSAIREKRLNREHRMKMREVMSLVRI